MDEELLIVIKVQNEASKVAREIQQQMEKIGGVGSVSMQKVNKASGLTIKSMAAMASAVFAAIGAVHALRVAMDIAAAAIGKMVDILRSAVTISGDYQNELAQVRAALESTAGAAGLTLTALTDLATQMAQTTKFTEGMVLEAESILLTFTKISKEVFPDTVKIMLDMATRMKGDLKGAAIQLGKALNDPITGVSALAEVGVSFTDQQKEMIKTLIETGDRVSAMRLILDELTVEFGGSATAAVSTFTGRIDLLGNNLVVLLRRLGDVVTTSPELNRVLELGIGLAGDLAAMLERDSEAFQKLRSAMRSGIQIIGAAVEALLRTMAQLAPVVVPVVNLIIGQFINMGLVLTGSIEGMIKSVRGLAMVASQLPGPFQSAAQGVLGTLADMDAGMDQFQIALGDVHSVLGDLSREALSGEFTANLNKAADAVGEFTVDVLTASTDVQDSMNSLTGPDPDKPGGPAQGFKAISLAIKTTADELDAFQSLAQGAFDRAQDLGEVFQASPFTAGQFLDKFRSELDTVFAELKRLGVEMPVELQPVADALEFENAVLSINLPPLPVEFDPPKFNTEFVEGFSSMVSSGAIQGLQDALANAEDFGDALATVSRNALAGIFDKALENLQAGLENLLSQLTAFQQGLLTAGLIAAAAIFGSSSSSETSFSSPTGGEQVTGAQPVRGVVAGPTTMATGEISRSLLEGFRLLNNTMLRIEQILLQGSQQAMM